MSAVIMRVSWNQDALQQYVRACLWCCALLAVMLVTPLVIAAVTPVVVGCCSAVVASVPEIAIVVAVFYGAWMVKP